MSDSRYPPSETRLRAARGGVQRTVLIAKRDALAAKGIAGEARDTGWTPRVATTRKVALELATELPDALVVSFELPDGSGFDVVGAVRARDPDVPAMMVATAPRTEYINRARVMRVEHACKPYETGAIADFLRRCEEEGSYGARFAVEVDQVAAGHDFADALAELLLAATVETTTVKVLAERLGKSPSTIRTQAREIYRRLGAQSFEDVVAAIRSRVLRRR